MGGFNGSPVSRRALIVAAAAVALCGSLPAGAAAQEGSLAADRAALEALYDATDGPNWKDSTNWLTDAPLSEWFGVATDRDGRVTQLRLPGNALSGPVPAELGQLSRLWTLDLGCHWDSGLGSCVNNELTGSIPSSLGRLSNLRRLLLRGNDLSGQIPDALGDLANLESLYLNYNGLTGPIPAALARLTNLKWLNLYGNGLTGPIPAALGDLTNLERLYLGDNELTGSIPTALGRLTNLDTLFLNHNGLTGPIPAELGDFANLERLYLTSNDLTGPIPAALGRLSNLKELRLSYNWGLSGRLPAGLEGRLDELDIFITQTCAPTAWLDWLATIDFLGRPCGAGTDVTIDVAVVYTPAARADAGGTAAIEAEIDLMVAEANQAFETSGVRHRLALVATSEVQYTETWLHDNLRRLADPSDGYMDEVHAMRDRTGADLVHLVFKRQDEPFGGMAQRPGPFALTCQSCGGGLFTHELGHNLGLRHDRYNMQHFGHGGLSPDPAFGYVNQRAFEAGAPESSRWVTIMGITTQCNHADVRCSQVFRFSNPLQRHNGDPLGIPFGEGAGVTGPADAVAVLNATGPAVALWRDRPHAGDNRPPAAAQTLPDQALTLPGALEVDVSGAFADPDGDALTYAASSSSPQVVATRVAGAVVTLTAVSTGTAAIRVTATDPGGLSAAQSFTVTVSRAPMPFTDHPVRPGETPIRAVHFTELRQRIDALRASQGLGRFRWTDPALRAGVTPVRLVHLLELRSALEAAYRAAGRSAPRWTDPAPVRGRTPIRAAHLMELRAAVVALE